MATVQRCGYMVHRWQHQPVIIITASEPLYMEPDAYDRLDDDEFEAFMTAWHAGDYAQTQLILGEPDPRNGLKHLAEANEREKAAQAGETRPEPDTLPELVARLREHGLNVAADFFDSVKPVVARDQVVPAGPPLRPFRGNAYGDPDDTPWPTLDQEGYMQGREADGDGSP